MSREAVLASFFLPLMEGLWSGYA